MVWFKASSQVAKRSKLLSSTVVKTVCCCLSLMISWQSHAAWFETQGQAEIRNGNKMQAKQQATEAAIKQALIFAGASIRSVQSLTNGLLDKDGLEITSSGEVNQLELIAERWHDDYVTVSIRADIFPKTQQCSQAGNLRTLATTYFPIEHFVQAKEGSLEAIGEASVQHLRQLFQQHAQYSAISAIAPYAAQWQSYTVQNQAPALATQYQTQYVLTGIINDLSIHRPESASLAFWKDDMPMRTFSLSISLIDGANGARVFDKTYDIEAPWDYDRFVKLDPFSRQFWRTDYGQAVSKELATLVDEVDNTLACQPVTGRVLAVSNNQLNVSLGRMHGISPGDTLSLYQVEEFFDNLDRKHMQYRLFPVKVKVVEAFVDNATVESVDGSYLANIQANDFVAKR